MESILSTLQSLEKEFTDQRVTLFDIQAQEAGSRSVRLSGRVLEQAQLARVQQIFETQFPDWTVDTSALRALRVSNPIILSVNTNLTGLYTSPSFLAELSSQVLFGATLEILEEAGEWAFVRQMDGYLGWVYRPYLTDQLKLQATHLVVEPVSALRAGPNPRAEVVTRVYGGTAVQVISLHNPSAQIVASRKGWIELSDLRSQAEMPDSENLRRMMMVQDAVRMVGVPYLWGGCTANGIDCSGFAQLLHRWVGIAIPRDADMQYQAGKPVEAPFQPGDLVFFGDTDEKRTVSHVAVSLGGWNVIHASRARNGVYIENVRLVSKLRDNLLFGRTFLA